MRNCLRQHGPQRGGFWGERVTQPSLKFVFFSVKTCKKALSIAVMPLLIFYDRCHVNGMVLRRHSVQQSNVMWDALRNTKDSLAVGVKCRWVTILESHWWGTFLLPPERPTHRRTQRKHPFIQRGCWSPNGRRCGAPVTYLMPEGLLPK